MFGRMDGVGMGISGGFVNMQSKEMGIKVWVVVLNRIGVMMVGMWLLTWGRAA